MPEFEKIMVKRFKVWSFLLDVLQWRWTGPASMDAILRVVGLGQTGWSQTGNVILVDIVLIYS